MNNVCPCCGACSCDHQTQTGVSLLAAAQRVAAPPAVSTPFAAIEQPGSTPFGVGPVPGKAEPMQFERIVSNVLVPVEGTTIRSKPISMNSHIRLIAIEGRFGIERVSVNGTEMWSADPFLPEDPRILKSIDIFMRAGDTLQVFVKPLRYEYELSSPAEMLHSVIIGFTRR